MSAHFSVPRKTPQEAAAAFISTHVADSRQLFASLGRELSALPDLGPLAFRTCKKEFTLSFKLLGTEDEHARLSRQFETRLQVAVATAVRVWVMEALHDPSGLRPDPVVDVDDLPNTLKISVELPLF